MSGSEEDRTIADSRTESTFYRRKPGIGWLLALLIVPLLLALIGWGAAAGRTDRDDVLAAPSVPPSATMTVPSAVPSTGAAASPSAPAADDRPFGPMSIVRSGNGFRLTGELPDTNMKTSLLDSLGQAMPGARVVDELTVNPAVKGPEFSALGALFGTALDIDGFSSTLVGNALTLAGKAPSADVKAAAFASAGVAWPNVQIVNDIQVDATSSTASTPPPPAAPAPAPAGVCSTLQADVTGLLRTPITFDTDGSTLAPASQRLVGQIADKLKGCPAAKVAVVGYTDDTGGDRINVPLSASRAKAVADALVSDGVTRGGVTSQGAGSAKPVAGNDTPAGRAQNRRVEITVS